MFVRFGRYRLKNGGITLRAELVESYRDERKGGNPHNRYVSYLGSIREHDCLHPVAQAKFWNSVEARLKSLCLSFETETQIREKFRL
jgi:hypothetical protein